MKDSGVSWRLAVITKLFISRDGLVRTEEIRTSTGTKNQPITKLFPTEVSSTIESTQGPQRRPEEDTAPRPLRQSARRAKDKMSELIKTLYIDIVG